MPRPPIEPSDDDEEFIEQLRRDNIEGIRSGEQTFRYNRGKVNKSGCLVVTIVGAGVVVGVVEVISRIL